MAPGEEGPSGQAGPHGSQPVGRPSRAGQPGGREAPTAGTSIPPRATRTYRMSPSEHRQAAARREAGFALRLLAAEDVGIVSEGFELDGVACRIAKEHRPLLARASGEADVGSDDELHSAR